jgi:hypothetical protein
MLTFKPGWPENTFTSSERDSSRRSFTLVFFTANHIWAPIHIFQIWPWCFDLRELTSGQICSSPWEILQCRRRCWYFKIIPFLEWLSLSGQWQGVNAFLKCKFYCRAKSWQSIRPQGVWNELPQLLNLAEKNFLAGSDHAEHSLAESSHPTAVGHRLQVNCRNKTPRQILVGNVSETLCLGGSDLQKNIEVPNLVLMLLLYRCRVMSKF